MIESITPRSTLCQGDTHTHIHTFTGSPMGHSDTVQIKKETDGYVDLWKERQKGRECVVLCGIYLFLFSHCVLMCLPKP